MAGTESISNLISLNWIDVLERWKIDIINLEKKNIAELFCKYCLDNREIPLFGYETYGFLNHIKSKKNGYFGSAFCDCVRKEIEEKKKKKYSSKNTYDRIFILKPFFFDLINKKTKNHYYNRENFNPLRHQSKILHYQMQKKRESILKEQGLSKDTINICLDCDKYKEKRKLKFNEATIQQMIPNICLGEIEIETDKGKIIKVGIDIMKLDLLKKCPIFQTQSAKLDEITF